MRAKYGGYPTSPPDKQVRAASPSGGQGTVDAGQEAVEGSETEGTADDLGDARSEQLNPAAYVEVGRDDDEGRALLESAGGGQQEISDLQVVEARQLVVEDHDVERFGGKGDECAPGVPGFLHPVAEHADRDAGQVAPVVIPIDDEDSEPLPSIPDAAHLRSPAVAGCTS